jgi:hypothetical protein
VEERKVAKSWKTDRAAPQPTITPTLPALPKTSIARRLFCCRYDYYYFTVPPGPNPSLLESLVLCQRLIPRLPPRNPQVLHPQTGILRIPTCKTVTPNTWTTGNLNTKRKVRKLARFPFLFLSSEQKTCFFKSSHSRPRSAPTTTHSHTLSQRTLPSHVSTFPLTSRSNIFADQPPSGQYQQGQDPRGASFSSAPGPDYGLAPASARSGTFPEYIHQRPPYTPGQAPAQGGMAHPTSPSSMPLQHTSANSQAPHNLKSNTEVPIDPSIATSPTYPPQPHYSPYQGQPDMSQHPGYPGVYGRPEWASGQYSPATPMGHYGHPASSGPPSAGLVSPVNTLPSHFPGGKPQSYALNRR